MKIKAVTGIVVAVMGAMALGLALFNFHVSGRPPTPPAVPGSIQRSLNKTQIALKERNWSAVAKFLNEASDEDAMLKQVLIFTEDPSHMEDYGEIYPLLIKELDKKDLSAQNQVFVFRALSFMNLNENQQKEVRHLFTKMKLRKDFLPQVFLSTQPYPMDQTQYLLNQVKSKVPGKGTEALYLAGQIKDVASKKNLTQKLLTQFEQTSPVLKPYVAKFVIVQGDAKLRQEKSYTRFIAYVRQQKGELWSEVHQVIQ